MSKRKKLKVAITGNIGSGKSTFSYFLIEEGYPVIFADDLSKEILSYDPKVRKEIISKFGSGAFSGNSINKSFLADKIFSNPEKLKLINSILHPLVRKKIEELADEYFLEFDFVFVEAALIYESKIEKLYDLVVLICADESVREQRTVKSKKFSKNDFKQRNNNQLSDEVKIKKADFVFINNGTKRELRQKVLLLISILESYLKS